jgi:hypothetical protein
VPWKHTHTPAPPSTGARALPLSTPTTTPFRHPFLEAVFFNLMDCFLRLHSSYQIFVWFEDLQTVLVCSQPPSSRAAYYSFGSQGLGVFNLGPQATCRLIWVCLFFASVFIHFIFVLLLIVLPTSYKGNVCMFSLAEFNFILKLS